MTSGTNPTSRSTVSGRPALTSHADGNDIRLPVFGEERRGARFVLGDPATFVMIEAWDDAEAHARHEATPHFLELVKTIGEVADIKIAKLNQLL